MGVEMDHLRAAVAEFDTTASGYTKALSDLNAAQNQVITLQTKLDAALARVAELEGTAPPPPPVEPPTGTARYPSKNDPTIGVPAGTVLTQKSAGGTITVNGAKFSGYHFHGPVVIAADDVEFFNCRIDSGAVFVLDVKGKRANIHHCDIVGTKSGSNGINTRDAWVHHNRLLKHENPVNVAGSGSLIEWNEMWDMGGTASAHIDGIQADGAIDGLIIRNNYINNENSDTSAVMLDNYWGAIKNVLVENNYLGGGGFPGYLDGRFKGAAMATNITYRDNDMRKGGWNGYFFWQGAGTGCVRTGNKDYATGANVDNA